MKNKARHLYWLAAAALALPSVAAAHPMHWWADGPVGFYSGLAHPFSGNDHIYTLLAVGFWLARLHGRAAWAMSAGFVALLLAGGGLVSASVQIAHAEGLMNLAALLLVMLLVSGGRSLSPLSALVVGGLALLHGYVHAEDIWLDGGVFAYTAGFAISTAALIAAGAALQCSVGRFARRQWTAYRTGTSGRF